MKLQTVWMTSRSQKRKGIGRVNQNARSFSPSSAMMQTMEHQWLVKRSSSFSNVNFINIK